MVSRDLKAKVLMKTRVTPGIPKGARMATVILAALVVSLVAVQAQTLTLSGTLVASSPSQALTGVYPPPNDTNNGTISTWVVNDPALDSLGNIFVYQVVNDGPDSIDQVELTSFSSSQIVSTGTYSLESGLALTGSATPSSNGNFPTFEEVGNDAANFEGGALPNGGAVSYFLVIDTDVSLVGSSYGSVQDSFTAAGSILVPVPEPSSPLVLLAGLACLCIYFRYRRVTGSSH